MLTFSVLQYLALKVMNIEAVNMGAVEIETVGHCRTRKCCGVR